MVKSQTKPELILPRIVGMNLVDSWQGSTILAATEDEVVGKTLNNTYLVERIVGEGAMGRIYLARHTRIAQKCVAVKVLRAEYLRNADVLARFQREAETAASICHPNVVAVYDVDRTARGLSYLVTEYLDGLDLAQYLKQQKKLSLPTALHIARQLCEGLGAAHRCGVIHRDLKPSNIFLVGDFAGGIPKFPFVKILDFGLSKFMDASDGEMVTEHGMIMGTPAYMPPEQALAQQADLRADIYGVGALLYVCLTGRPPFDEATPQATVVAVARTEPARPRAIDPSIPEHVELVIQRAMSKLPAARYPDMAALLDALEPLLEDQPVRYEVRSLRPKPPSSFNKLAERAELARPRLMLFLGLALALLIGSATVAVAGIGQGTGWSPTRLELGLLLAFGVAAAITPAVLFARWIRRRVWENTNRVLDLSSKVRIALIAVVATYGLAWLSSRVLDGVALKLMGRPSRVNLAWTGWDFLLPLIAVGVGVVALLREWALSKRLSGRRRAQVVALASLLTLALAAVAIPVGLHRQAQQARSARAQALAAPGVDLSVSKSELAQPASSASVAVSASAQPAMQPESMASSAVSATPATKDNASPVASSEPAQLASKEDLRAATGRGEIGLLPLADRYPNDPRVLRRLALAHASHAGGLADGMMVVRRLFQVAPEEAKSMDMQYLVQRAAEVPGPPADLAWKLLAEQMGTHGPDVLYRISLTKPKLTEHAKQLLGDAAVRQLTSPALAIALELRSAPSCSARVPLLDRAVEEGDERAITVLAGLSTGTRRGCGKYKRAACVPACPEQADEFRRAIAKLSQRLRTSGT
jgi:serine/threonine protein kinase